MAAAVAAAAAAPTAAAAAAAAPSREEGGAAAPPRRRAATVIPLSLCAFGSDEKSNTRMQWYASVYHFMILQLNSTVSFAYCSGAVLQQWQRQWLRQ